MTNLTNSLQLMSLRTPYFLFDETRLEASVGAIKSALNRFWPNHIISYSVKTNNWNCILTRLLKLGVWAETVSVGEYNQARACGFAGDRIICNGVAKSREWIMQAIEDGALLHLDGLDEVRDLVDVMKGRPVAFGVRVNATEADFQSEPLSGPLGSRFGLSYRDGDLHELRLILDANPNLKLVSLHLHCNTKGRVASGYVWLTGFFARLVREFRFTDIRTFDVGGSFGHDFDNPASGRWPDWPEYFAAIAQVLTNEGFDCSTLRLAIEPGSALISASADYFMQIVGERLFNGKRVLQTNGSRVHVDPHLARASFAGSITPVSLNNQPVDTDAEAVYLAGATCLEKDRMDVNGAAARARKGDILKVSKAAAYSYAMSPCSFINPPPKVYVKLKSGEIVDA